MKNKMFTMVLAVVLAMPMLFADNSETEVEIQLIEVVDAGFIGGDDPLGNPNKEGALPTRPNDFHATIAGRSLSVTADNANMTHVIVRNSTGNIVVNRQFFDFTTEQLTTSGVYSIEIQSEGITLVGQFNAQ